MEEFKDMTAKALGVVAEELKDSIGNGMEVKAAEDSTTLKDCIENL